MADQVNITDRAILDYSAVNDIRSGKPDSFLLYPQDVIQHADDLPENVITIH